MDGEIAVLLAGSDGQVLTTLPGVATSRAAAFAAFSLPIARFASAEHLYSATGLAPASYRSATINRRSPISRQGAHLVSTAVSAASQAGRSRT